MNVSKQVAAALLDANAFKVSLGPLFTWTSGIKSPVYCDLRCLNSDVEGRRLIVDALVELVPEDTDVIAGTATAGISWAAWVAEKLGKPMVYVRSKSKEHGAKKQVEGIVKAGQKVVVVEDLISTGGSSIRTVDSLKEECEVIVELVLAINTYLMKKADDNFSVAGVQLKTITNAPIIFSVARERGVLTEEQETMLKDFGDDPNGWAERHGIS